MSITDQIVEGDIVVDEISTLDLDMSGSVLTGSINADNSGGNISVSLDETAHGILHQTAIYLPLTVISQT